MFPDETQRHRLFLRLFTANEAAVRAFVRRLVPARADADDIMQEVSVVLWEKFDTFRADGEFRSWAFGVARYEVLAWFRDRGRDRLVLSERAVELLGVEAEIHEAQREPRREALERCIAEVTPEQRGLLLRAYAPGARIADLARESGRTEPGLYQWLYRLRKLLLTCIRNRMGKEGMG